MARLLPTAATIALAAIVISCGGARKTSDPGPRGTLRFECDPDDAIVEIDETLLGPARMFAKNGLLLKPGTHRVVLKEEGYFPEYQLVEIVEGEVVVIEKTLRKVPD